MVLFDKSILNFLHNESKELEDPGNLLLASSNESMTIFLSILSLLISPSSPFKKLKSKGVIKDVKFLTYILLECENTNKQMKKMKEIVFIKYFLGSKKSGRGIEIRWNDDNKYTKRLYDFVSNRKFDEYGNITHKVCKYDGRLYEIEMFGKDKKSVRATISAN